MPICSPFGPILFDFGSVWGIQRPILDPFWPISGLFLADFGRFWSIQEPVSGLFKRAEAYFGHALEGWRPISGLFREVRGLFWACSEGAEAYLRPNHEVGIPVQRD